MKHLKSYKLFEEKTYEFGCVMVDVPVKNWNEITSFIDTDDIYTVSDNDNYGIQDRPHLTLLYGTHKEVTSEQVESLLKNVKPFSIEIDGVDIFENKDYDVVKFNVKKNDLLQSIFDSLSTLPNSNSFKDYNPHITIAYVKKGTGKKYIKSDYKWKVDNINEVTYSMVDGNEYKFSLDNINESFEFKSKSGEILNYDQEWKLPNSSIREMITADLRNILFELRNFEYSIQLTGFVSSSSKPHIWICNKKQGKRVPINFSEIEQTLLRVEDYFEANGFSTKRVILNEGKDMEQLYIYFDLKQE